MKTALILCGLLVLAVVFRRTLGGVGRLAVRSGLWLGFLWLFKGIGSLIGVSLGVNLFNAAVLGMLGVPGLALLMMTQWIFR